MSELLSGISGAALVLVVLIFWSKAYFEPYLKRKAENLATHEDVERLITQVRETERVKAEIADRMWDRQSKWTAKKECYISLVEQLTRIIDLMNEYVQLAITMKDREDASPLRSHLTEMGQHGSEMAKHVNVSRLFMPADVLQAYLTATQCWGDALKVFLENPRAEAVAERIAYREKMLAFIEAARTDLIS
jgi:hypothetical protein